MKTKAILLILFIALFHAASVRATIHLIETEDFEFNPSTLTVSVGDTIRWYYHAGYHTTTSTSIPSGAAMWTAPIDPGNASYDYVVTMPGNYLYQCDFHYTMGMTGSFTAIGSTGIPETSQAFPVSVMSQLIKESLTIQFNTAPENWSIEFISLVGNQLRSIRPARHAYPITLNYSVADLPAGIYIVRLTDGKQLKAVRLVKEN